jgi:hypothetical protein
MQRKLITEPELLEEERASGFGTYIPTQARASHKSQVLRSKKKRGSSLDTAEPKQALHTDDLSEEAASHPVPQRCGKKRSLSALRPLQTTRQSRLAALSPRGRLILAGVVLVFALLLVWLGYTGVWAGKVQIAHMGNSWRFQGHTPTDTLLATMNGQKTLVVATNTGERISVYIVIASQKMQILSEPLSSASWGSDPGQVVPSLSIVHGTILLTLTGDPQYGGQMNPLEASFLLTPTATGIYQIAVA